MPMAAVKHQDAVGQTYLDDRRTTKQSAWSLRADSKKQPLTSGISIINIYVWYAVPVHIYKYNIYIPCININIHICVFFDQLFQMPWCPTKSLPIPNWWSSPLEPRCWGLMMSIMSPKWHFLSTLPVHISTKIMVTPTNVLIPLTYNVAMIFRSY